MIELTHTAAGRKWLAGCLLRVYLPADYPSAWRRHFAARLGLSNLPGGDGDDAEADVAPEGGLAVGSAADLDSWVREAGLTDKGLAERLGVSRSYVSRQRSGRGRW